MSFIKKVIRIWKLLNIAIKLDRLGIAAFIYIIFYAAVKLNSERDILTIILLVIGVLGLLVDGTLTLLHNKK